MAELRMVVPPGQSAPLSTITSTDHGAWIIISTALGLSLSLLFAAIRVFIRSATKHGYGKDDYTLAGATLLASVQSIVLLGSCADGLGKSKSVLSPESLSIIQRKYYASNILFVVALSLSRTSVAYFLMQLTPIRQQRRFIQMLLVFITIWGLALLVAVTLACDLSDPWTLVDKQCKGYLLRWQIMEILGCVHEAATFGVAVWLVWGLRTSRSNKTTVLIAFGFRLLMIAIVRFRLASFDGNGLHEDPTIRESQFITWTSAELHYSLVAATIPIIRPFMSILSTNYGAGQGPEGRAYGQGSTNSHHNPASKGRDRHATTQSFELKSMTRRAARFSHCPSSRGLHHDDRNPVESSSACNVPPARDANAGSTRSNESQRMIVRKDVTWQVNREK